MALSCPPRVACGAGGGGGGNQITQSKQKSVSTEYILSKKHKTSIPQGRHCELTSCSTSEAISSPKIKNQINRIKRGE